MTKIKSIGCRLDCSWGSFYWTGTLIGRMSWLGLLLAPLYPVGCPQSAQPASVEHRVDPSPSEASADGKTFVLVGAGDIASCKDPEGARATAKLIEQIPGTVFAAGDLAYEKGSAEDFKDCYD